MTASPYLDAVGQYLRADGWEIGSTEIQPGTFLIAGQQSNGGDRSIVVMAVTADAGQATPDHLEQLLETSREEGVDLAILAAEAPVDDELQSTAADNEVHVLDNADLDMQESAASATDAEAADGEPIEMPSTIEQEPTPVEPDPSAAQEPPAAESTDHDSFPDPRKQLQAYLSSKLSRRRVLAGSVLLAGGTAAGGYGWYRFAPSPLERFKAETEAIAYDDLQADPEQYLGTAVYYSSARVAQRIATDGDDRLRLQVTRDESGVWQDDLLGRWGGDPYAPGDRVEFWGVVNGAVRYETSLGIERTVPDIDLVDIAPVDG